jgi:hypothetical protein
MNLFYEKIRGWFHKTPVKEVVPLEDYDVGHTIATFHMMDDSFMELSFDGYIYYQDEWDFHNYTLVLCVNHSRNIARESIQKQSEKGGFMIEGSFYPREQVKRVEFKTDEYLVRA